MSNEEKSKKEKILKIIYESDLNKEISLNLSSSQLTELPSEIGRLKFLKNLDLSNNQLSEIPIEIAQLKKLNRLNLSNNQFTELPIEITQLKKLAKLDLSGNLLTKLSREIARLNELTKLYLDNNQIREISPEIIKLKNLNSLVLRKNRLKKLPTEILQLKNLSKLDLDGNHLIKLPPEIAQLENLAELHLTNNKLTNLPAGLAKLKYLGLLDLRKNKFTQVTKEILSFKLFIEYKDTGDAFSSGIQLSGNPIPIPPVLIEKQGQGAIYEYYKSLLHKKRKLNEAKVLLVGEGAAGKTSLAKRVMKNEFNKNESQTHGINIDSWSFNNKKDKMFVNFWDFGGQEIMHATHQFFLSERSLYVLVVDTRKDEKTEYWLKHIESFGGDSPVLVVINKIDENPGFDLRQMFLQNKYKNIIGFYRVSCLNNKGIKTFKNVLKRELRNIEIGVKEWANSWFDVKTLIANMEKPFINYNEYRTICKECGVHEKEQGEVLVKFLNDLGIAVHFEEFDLQDTYILEPNWVTTAVYKIINSPILAEAKGILDLKYLDEILEKKDEEIYFYPYEQYRYIVQLMIKFELCYTLPRNRILVPDLLPVSEPELEFNYDRALQFFIQYDFLPRTIMPRFIVKMHRDIKKKMRWRSAVVLEEKAFQSTAVIKADEEAKRIYIWVDGEQNAEYFAVILFTLRDINGSFEKLEAIEKVPMPDNPKLSVAYETLLELEKDGDETYRPDGAKRRYNVKELLGRIQSQTKTVDELIILIKWLMEKLDDKEKAKNIIMAQPNFHGLGINLNNLFESLFGKNSEE